MIVACPTRTPATSVIALAGPGRPRPMTIPRSRARTLPPAVVAPPVAGGRPRRRPIAVRHLAGGSRFGARSLSSPGDPCRGRPFRLAVPGRPARAARRSSPTRRPIDVAEALRDLPGLALLESARPGRNARWTYLTADPVAVLDRARRRRRPVRRGPPPAGAAGAGAPAPPPGGRTRPPFLGGPRRLPRLRARRRPRAAAGAAADDQGLPPLRLALHDWAIAWDRRTGSAWLAGRALDGDADRLTRRLAEVRAPDRPGRVARRDGRRRRADDPADDGRRRRSRSRRRSTGAAYEAGVEAVRERIARGDLYQANLTRRLAAPFDGDPWPLYRRLRTGDPSLFSAYLDLGGGAPATDPCSAARLPGRARSCRRRRSRSSRSRRAASSRPTRSRARGRAAGPAPRTGPSPASCSPSAKDRAENVMIVDVLRNDLGRVCIPGTVRVPAAVPARADGGRPASRLDGHRPARARPRRRSTCSRASFPGGSITGAPKIRAMEILRELEPTRRGPYTGALGWIGPDGAMATSILIRTFVADGTRLSLHVGGGITYQSEPAAEWDETVAKARGPLAAIGGREVGSEVSGSTRDAGPRLDRRPDRAGRRAGPDARSIAASSSATASSRRSAPAAGRPTELAEHAARMRRSAAGLAIDAARTTSRRAWRAAIDDLLAAEGLAGSDGDASVRITVSRGRVLRPRAAAARRAPEPDDRRPGVAGRAAAGVASRGRPAPRRELGPARSGEPAERR